MKLLTKKTQEEIRVDRNIIYDYILSISPPVERLKDFEKAIEALTEISCDCGLWDKPWEKDGGGE